MTGWSFSPSARWHAEFGLPGEQRDLVVRREVVGRCRLILRHLARNPGRVDPPIDLVPGVMERAASQVKRHPEGVRRTTAGWWMP